MTDSAVSDWQRGGLRYLKLQEIVPEFLEPAQVQGFFVAVRSHGGFQRLINPLAVLQREYVIAATENGVAVIGLRRPGIFRASIAGIVFQATAAEASANWQDGKFEVGGTTYRPIAFHEEDAKQVAKLLS